MQLRFALTAVLAAMTLTACGSMGLNNGSLKYKNTKTLEPIQYPEGFTVRPARPLYPAPVIDPLALQHAPILENKNGKRFELPRPEETVERQAAVAQALQAQAVGRPQMLADGNGNPLIKIDGRADEVWKYIVATLSSINAPVVTRNDSAYEATIKVDDQAYIVRLLPAGSSNNIAIFNTNSGFADQSKATELLTQIYQNWPA
ncbi:lipoprotein-34 precursor (NlpB) [Acinetobacter larvae]|uniref:Lipoprotein-34 (NlpB) n=1 Tax=Acinetobacter larvae TaxID=1789224 RepID=A0A1B2M4A5_9GAMM|nr:lipoprotein-34 precursor (NlpB) [Acinetobacter larvae]AOA60037.1 lipoprotein-34 precursor (NlpB) [Acinetobacter larvae]